MLLPFNKYRLILVLPRQIIIHRLIGCVGGMIRKSVENKKRRKISVREKRIIMNEKAFKSVFIRNFNLMHWSVGI
jgi:hypothetical protein